MYYLQDEPRQKAYNVYSNMSSYFKGREGGAASSFNSVRFYNNQAKNKRAELIEKYNTELAVAVHTGDNWIGHIRKKITDYNTRYIWLRLICTKIAWHWLQVYEEFEITEYFYQK